MQEINSGSTSDLILTELRDLSTRFNNNAIATGERLASLETSMYSLVGNGQPGRIGLLEDTVDKLQELRWWLIGAAAGVSAVVSVIAWMIKG